MTQEFEIVLHRRRILLKDGRYLIFFTFDGADECPPSEPPAETKAKEDD